MAPTEEKKKRAASLLLGDGEAGRPLREKRQDLIRLVVGPERAARVPEEHGLAAELLGVIARVGAEREERLARVHLKRKGQIRG